MMFPCPGATTTTSTSSDKLGIMSTMSIEYDSVGTDGCLIQDEEVNCVFCGRLFPSIERIQEHIAQCHEAVEPVVENQEVKIEAKRVLDIKADLILATKTIEYNNGVIQCSKCDLLFASPYASRIHFEKVHLGRKRKRSTNPNGVEGIIINPNGSDNWGCDICGRQFPTLKQAKVHKFKSHIEPVQKKKMMLHRNIIRKNTVSQRNYVKKMIAENKFREILPSSKKSKIDSNCQSELNSQHGNNDGESSTHSDQQGSQSASGGTTGGGRPSSSTTTTTTTATATATATGAAASAAAAAAAIAGNLWRAAQASSRGNKIVISRVYQSESLLPDAGRSRYGFLQRSGHSCFYCREVFLNKESFKRHLLLHQEKKSYKCRSCGSKFKRIKMLQQHQRLNCELQFTSTSETSEHDVGAALNLEVYRKSEEQTVTIIAKVEKQAGPPKIAVTQHKEEDISPRDLKFAEKFLDNPSITLNKGSQCVCNLCQSCFYSNNSILRHLVLYHRIAAQDGSTALVNSRLEPLQRSRGISHNGLEQQSADLSTQGSGTGKPSLHFIHNCDSCGSQFASKKGLQRHMHSVHLVHGDSPYCSECNLSFPDPQALDVHRDECPGWSSSSPGALSRRVKCEVCGRRFRNPVTLEEHRRAHCSGVPVDGSEPGLTGAEPDTRVNVFVLGGALKTAVDGRGGARQRDGGKRNLSYGLPAYKKAKVPPNSDGLFECDVCHKTFTCRSSLSNHVKSHFNFKNKPFSCSACHQGFMSTLTLQHHRDQLCPSMGGGEYVITSLSPVVCTTNPTTTVSGVDSSLQHTVAIFSNFDGVSQVQPGNGGISNTSGNGNGNSGPSGNLTTRATSCMHCSAMFPDRSLLEDHASKEHSNHAGEVVCIICPRSFTTYMAFRVHMTKSHGGPNGTSLKSHLNTAANSAHKTSNANFDMIQELSLSLSNEHRSTSPPNGGKLHPLNNLPFHLLPRHFCPNCDKDFSTSQALGNHKRACMPHLYKKVSL